MKRIILIIGILVVMMFSGCTSHKIVPVDKKHDLQYVCIENNPKVVVTDYIQAVEDIFYTYGIATDLYNKGNIPEYCNVKMTYTASRRWDMAHFITYANVLLFKNGAKIGYAEYSNGGGFDLSKWGSSKEKMTPVLEKMLVQYEKKDITFDKSKYKKQSLRTERTEVSLKGKLTEIKKMHDDGLITQEEYATKRKQLLNDY